MKVSRVDQGLTCCATRLTLLIQLSSLVFSYSLGVSIDLAHHSINLLGTIEQHPEIRDRDTKNVKSERAPAIILLVKTPLRNSSRPDHVARLVENLAKVESLGSNDVYRWYLAWAAAAREDEECNADYKVTVIMPATETVS